MYLEGFEEGEIDFVWVGDGSDDHGGKMPLICKVLDRAQDPHPFVFSTTESDFVSVVPRESA